MTTADGKTVAHEDEEMTYQEYDALEANGQPAQAFVGGTLRGGFVLDESFYFVGARREKVPVTSVRELKLAPYTA